MDKAELQRLLEFLAAQSLVEALEPIMGALDSDKSGQIDVRGARSGCCMASWDATTRVQCACGNCTGLC